MLCTGHLLPGYGILHGHITKESNASCKGEYYEVEIPWDFNPRAAGQDLVPVVVNLPYADDSVVMPCATVLHCKDA